MTRVIKGTLFLIDFTVSANCTGTTARMARAVAPGVAHHVTHRGNPRQKLFFEDGDYARYRELLAGGE